MNTQQPFSRERAFWEEINTKGSFERSKHKIFKGRKSVGREKDC